jgi:hypothetical protein
MAEYKYTDTEETPLALSMTLNDIRRLRYVLEAVLNGEVTDSRVQHAAQDTERFLTQALAKAADAFENEGRSLRDRLERKCL